MEKIQKFIHEKMDFWQFAIARAKKIITKEERMKFNAIYLMDLQQNWRRKSKLATLKVAVQEQHTQRLINQPWC